MSAVLCDHCTGVCCRYIALPIEAPTTRGDFDDVRWYLLHEGISVFVEDGEWYLCIQTVCRHLQPDHRCGIYAARPRICRRYSTDGCDYHSGDYGWEQHFTSPEHLDEYARAELAGRRRRAARGRARGGGARRAGLRALARRRRPRRRGAGAGNGVARFAFDYAALTHDARGVPLPVLALGPARDGRPGAFAPPPARPGGSCA